MPEPHLTDARRAFPASATARLAAAVFAVISLGGCWSWHWERTVDEVLLADGTYAVNDPGQPDEVRAITAQVDRAAGQITFTLADGSRRAQAFTPRPKAEWLGACATMAGYTLDEVSDLTPAPLALGPITFQTPLVFPMCSANRFILADDLSGMTGLVFDRIPEG